MPYTRKKSVRVKTDEKLQIKSNKKTQKTTTTTTENLKLQHLLGMCHFYWIVYVLVHVHLLVARGYLFSSPAVLWMDFLHLKNHFTTSNRMTNKTFTNARHRARDRQIEKEKRAHKWQTQIKYKMEKSLFRHRNLATDKYWLQSAWNFIKSSNCQIKFHFAKSFQWF